MRRAILTERPHLRAVHLEDAYHPGLRRHVKAPPRRVPREDVGVVADTVRGEDAHRSKIQYLKAPVALTGDKGEPPGLVDREAVRMIGSRDVVACNDALGRGIDRDELVLRLHRDEDAV